jgi:hypothetical protein
MRLEQRRDQAARRPRSDQPAGLLGPGPVPARGLVRDGLSAVIAAYLPARKGGRVHPVDILRGARERGMNEAAGPRRGAAAAQRAGRREADAPPRGRGAGHAGRGRVARDRARRVRRDPRAVRARASRRCCTCSACSTCPSSGGCWLDGEDTSGFDEDRAREPAAREARLRVPVPLPAAEFSALDNVMMPMRRLGRLEADARPRAAACNCSATSASPTTSTSARRSSPAASASASRSRVRSPTTRSIVLADEPTGALDTKSSEQRAWHPARARDRAEPQHHRSHARRGFRERRRPPDRDRRRPQLGHAGAERAHLLRRVVGEVGQRAGARHHQRRGHARMAGRLVAAQRIVRVGRGGGGTAQHGRILQRHHRALPGERRHGMRRVAQQRRASARPGRQRVAIEQAPLEEPLAQERARAVRARAARSRRTRPAARRASRAPTSPPRPRRCAARSRRC